MVIVEKIAWRELPINTVIALWAPDTVLFCFHFVWVVQWGLHFTYYLTVMMWHYSLLVSIASKCNINDFDWALRSVLVFLVCCGHKVLEFVVLLLLHMYTLINTCNMYFEVSVPHRFYTYWYQFCVAVADLSSCALFIFKCRTCTLKWQSRACPYSVVPKAIFPGTWLAHCAFSLSFMACTLGSQW